MERQEDMTDGGPCTPQGSGCDVVVRKKSVAFQGGMTWDRHSSRGLTGQVWGAVSGEGAQLRGHCGSPSGTGQHGPESGSSCLQGGNSAGVRES